MASQSQSQQTAEAVLCYRKDGLLLTENNTSIVDLYDEVCATAPNAAQHTNNHQHPTLKKTNKQYDAQRNPKQRQRATSQRL